MNTLNDIQDEMFLLADAVIVARSMATALAEKTAKYEAFAVEMEERLCRAEERAAKLKKVIGDLRL